MATLSTLNAKLTLNTKGFRTNMQKAQARVVNFTKGVAKAGVQVAKYGAALGAVGAGALSVIVKQHLSAIDATAKFADRIGITTEALGGLRHAAGLAGTDSKALDMALQRMTRRVAEAAGGTGEAVGALEALGISAQELATLSPDQQFMRITDAMQGVSSQSEKVRLAFKLFDSEGVGLVNLMNAGTDSIQAAMEEAEKLGIAMTRLDAAKIEAANDALSRVGGLIQGAGQALTAELAPYIEAAAEGLLSMGTDGATMSEKIGGAVEWVATGIAKLSDWLELGKAGFYTLQTGATGAIFGLIKAIDMANHALASMLNMIPGITVEADQGITMLADNLEAEMNRAADSAEAAWNRFTEGANSAAVTTAFAKIRADAEKNAQAIADAAEARIADGGDLPGEGEARGWFTGVIEGLGKGVEQITDFAKDAFDTAGQALLDAQQRMKERDAPQGPSELVYAGSARAQQLAFAGGKMADDIPKRSLKEQQQSRKTLERIEAHLRPTAEQLIEI